MGQRGQTEELLPLDGVDILLAIRPEHAKRIYKGTKRFELRKVLPRLLPRRIFLLETSTGGSITGHVVISRAISAEPAALWRVTGIKGTSKERFFRYFEDRDEANAYEISCAVEYAKPVAAGAFANPWNSPQSFIYLDTEPVLWRVLQDTAISESLRRARNPGLRNIRPSSHSAFIDGVVRHIDGNYRETGDTYAKKILEIAAAGTDTEGIFTSRKTVLEITLNRQIVGFTTLTHKVGGSIKTGPTFFDEEHIGTGMGKRLRRSLEQVCRALGARKIYATVPAANYPAVNYLIASGYRVEAQLSRQYHLDHDELVLGALLDQPSPAEFRSVEREAIALDNFELIEAFNSNVCEYLSQCFSEVVAALPADWAPRQLREILLQREHPHSGYFKRRLLFEPPRESRRLLSVSYAALGNSESCR